MSVTRLSVSLPDSLAGWPRAIVKKGVAALAGFCGSGKVAAKPGAQGGLSGGCFPIGRKLGGRGLRRACRWDVVRFTTPTWARRSLQRSTSGGQS